MLLSQIQSDLVSAQKSRDQVKLDALRFLLGEIKNLEISKYPPSSRLGGTSEGHSPPSITDEDVIAVLQKQVKTHQESIEMFQKGGRSDLVNSEKSQLTILQSYLPAQMSEEEMRFKIKDLRANNPNADFGLLMRLAMGELKGKADGSLVSKILRELLK